MNAVTTCSDLRAPKNKVSHCFHCFPICFLEEMGLDAMILIFSMLNFKPTSSLSSFTFFFFFFFLVIFFPFIFISWRLITLQYCSGFLPYTDMNQPWTYMCSPSRSPLPPSSPPNPSGSSQCTSPEHLSHASNLGWWSVSPLIVYLLQCYSLRTSHPRLLPQSPKVCSVHLCLFFCFAYKVIIIISLNSIYMHCP